MRVERLIAWLLLAGLLFSFEIVRAAAGELALSGGERWVVLASRPSIAEAVEFAQTYSLQSVRVVESRNGYYAVVLGPYETPNIAAFRRSYSGPTLTADALLARGTDFVRTVWKAGEKVAETESPDDEGEDADFGGELQARRVDAAQVALAYWAERAAEWHRRIDPKGEAGSEAVAFVEGSETIVVLWKAHPCFATSDKVPLDDLDWIRTYTRENDNVPGDRFVVVPCRGGLKCNLSTSGPFVWRAKQSCTLTPEQAQDSEGEEQRPNLEFTSLPAKEAEELARMARAVAR